jgi:hypothetical protein
VAARLGRAWSLRLRVKGKGLGLRGVRELGFIGPLNACSSVSWQINEFKSNSSGAGFLDIHEFKLNSLI